MTGWHRHETIWMGGRHLAHAEKFKNSRRVPELGFCGTIRTGEGQTRGAAEAVLEARLD